MVEVSQVLQQPTFQSLCHDLLFHCSFLLVFCLWYFKQTVILIIYSFLCFTAWSINVWLSGRSFQYFGASRSWGNINSSYQHYQPGKINLHFSVLMIEYLVYWILIEYLYFVALMAIAAEIVVEKSSICMCVKRSHLKSRLLILSGEIF